MEHCNIKPMIYNIYMFLYKDPMAENSAKDLSKDLFLVSLELGFRMTIQLGNIFICFITQVVICHKQRSV